MCIPLSYLPHNHYMWLVPGFRCFMCVWLFDLSGRSVRIGDRCNRVLFDRFGLGPLIVSRMCVLGTLVSVSHVVCGRTFILAVFPSSGCLSTGVFGPGA